MPILYWCETIDGNWEESGNWYEDDACTIAASVYPWGSDTTYHGYDLVRSSLDTLGPVSIGGNIGEDGGITGTCYIDYQGSGGIFNNGSIFDGNFSETSGILSFINYGYIYGGNFNGPDFSNQGYILAGYFGIDSFENTGGSIYGGEFAISSLINSSGGQIFGGFFGPSSSLQIDDGYIYGGGFNCNSFGNQYGTIHGGMFTTANFSNISSYVDGGIWLESGKILFPVYAYDHASGDMVISRYEIMTGLHPNALPKSDPSLSYGAGFETLKIPGQDLIGAGLL
jgi:hypothetical protein